MSELPSRHYDDAVIIAPRCEDGYFAAYRGRYPEERFVHFTYEEVVELFSFSVQGDVLGFLEGQGYDRERANALLSCLRRMELDAYVSPELNALVPVVKSLQKEGYFQKRRDPALVFCGKKIVIRRYHSGVMIAEALQELPNINLNWDLDRVDYRDAPLERIEAPSFAEAVRLLEVEARKLEAEGTKLYLRYEGDKDVGLLGSLPRIHGPYCPSDGGVLYLETDPGDFDEDPLPPKALAELHVPCKAERIKRRDYDESRFALLSRLYARVYCKSE